MTATRDQVIHESVGGVWLGTAPTFIPFPVFNVA